MSKIYSKKLAYGLTPPLINIAADPIVATTDPTTNDRFDIGQLWTNTTLNTVFMLTSYVGGVPIWTELDNAGPYTGMVWTTEAGAAIPMANGHGYVVTNAAPILTLPAVSPLGSEMAIIGQGGIWRIAQNAGQQIRLGSTLSTAGVGGAAISAHGYTSARLETITANTLFEIVYTNDNINLI